MEVKKVYRVACGASDEELYRDKKEAESVHNYKQRKHSDCILEEINVIFNLDGSCQQISQSPEGICLDKTKRRLTELKSGGNKIYRVSCKREHDSGSGFSTTYSTISEYNFINKAYAEKLCQSKREEYKGNHFINAHLEEIDVVFNPNGSYREIVYKSPNKFPDQEI